MDWARDNTGLSELDLSKVFKYEPKQSTALVFLASQSTPVVSSLESQSDWENWLNEDIPSLESSEPGLVLILAKRAGEREFGTIQRIDSDGWLQRIDRNGQKRTRVEKTATFAALSEKFNPLKEEKPVEKNILSGGGRSVRTLPFSREVFKKITQRFCIHGSVARSVSRSDIPVFSSAEVEVCGPDGLKHMAYVYNCRTSHAWDTDLALTATYFPHSGLTFAILFGCPVETEEEIIKRLCFSAAEASHPLVMPGIFAELERTRHVHVAEKTISRLETHILELDFRQATIGGPQDTDADEKNEDKREAWLDTTYLRNGLISWNLQLMKMSKHVDELEHAVFKDDQSTETRRGFSKQMKRAAVKIETRLLELIEEYDAKIRDCTMRVDGMAMATQWSHGETNVEIAMATNRDSKQMRSLALLTMIFLPGTFFATVFSMTFFNWSGTDSPAVSPYIWVYLIFATISTVGTVGSWYYFVVHRRNRGHTFGDVESNP